MVSVNFATILTYIAFQRILPTIFVYYARNAVFYTRLKSSYRCIFMYR